VLYIVNIALCNTPVDSF